VPLSIRANKAISSFYTNHKLFRFFQCKNWGCPDGIGSFGRREGSTTRPLLFRWRTLHTKNPICSKRPTRGSRPVVLSCVRWGRVTNWPCPTGCLDLNTTDRPVSQKRKTENDRSIFTRKNRPWAAQTGNRGTGRVTHSTRVLYCTKLGRFQMLTIWYKIKR